MRLRVVRDRVATATYRWKEDIYVIWRSGAIWRNGALFGIRRTGAKRARVQESTQGDVSALGGVGAKPSVRGSKRLIFGPVPGERIGRVGAQCHRATKAGSAALTNKKLVEAEDHHAPVRIHTPQKIGEEQLVECVAAAQQYIACMQIAQRCDDIEKHGLLNERRLVGSIAANRVVHSSRRVGQVRRKAPSLRISRGRGDSGVEKGSGLVGTPQRRYISRIVQIQSLVSADERWIGGRFFPVDFGLDTELPVGSLVLRKDCDSTGKRFGLVSPEVFAKLCEDVVVVVQKTVENEFGTIQPLERLRRVLAGHAPAVDQQRL